MASAAVTAERGQGSERWRQVWASAWPKLLAVAIALAIWQGVSALYALGGRFYVMPSPAAVFADLRTQLGTAAFYDAVRVTMGRALLGYTMALVIGLVIGVSVVRVTVLRRAVGSLITGLQTMPSIVWLPFAIILFPGSELAIYLVVVLGAAPSIANSVILGVDHVSPELVRAGQILGVRGLGLYRRVVLPATLPALVSGMKQGWAFAWRSLMAGEILVHVGHSIGTNLNNAFDFSDQAGLMSVMIVILVIGILADALFSRADTVIRARRGLLNQAL
ncbi:MAG TPA: ABC transporter permease subunit [Candidatus Dormibacteraeota bacterium]|jgi:NitT/TauT family transport system permease protein|nr:ABC transporter permease subunit [Candidatus Dormibacteraeota bacterium]